MSKMFVKSVRDQNYQHLVGRQVDMKFNIAYIRLTTKNRVMFRMFGSDSVYFLDGVEFEEVDYL